MPQYFSPGVYVEEIDPGPRPIEGVNTSICGAVGVTAMGPTSGKPVLVTSFADFTRTFGGFLPDPDPPLIAKWTEPAEGGRYWQFPLAVKAFFDNGGSQLYVKRVVPASATSAAATLGIGLVAEITRDTKKDATLLTLRHLINIAKGASLTVTWGGGKTATVTVTGFDEVANTVTVNPAVPAPLSVKNGDFAVVHPVSAKSPPDPSEQTLEFSAKAKGAWGSALRVRVRPMVGGTYSLLVDPSAAGTPAALTTVKVATGPAPVDTITVDKIDGFAADDHVLIGGGEYVIDTVTTASGDIKIKDRKLTAGVGDSVRQLRKASTAAKTISVAGGAAIYANAIVEISNGTDKEAFIVSAVAGNVVTLSAAPTKAFLESHKLRVIEAEVTVQYAPAGSVATEEVFSNLALSDTGANYLPRLVKERSKLVDVVAVGLSVDKDLLKFPAAPITGQWQGLDGGDDSPETLAQEDFIGIDGGPGNRTGIQALEDIEQIAIVMVPGMWSRSIHNALVVHCEQLKSRFAILDPQDGLDMDGIQAFRSPYNTQYAALYYPWVMVRDPLKAQDVVMSPSGFMAGIYARVDDSRGVFKAPANEPILGIQRLEQDINKREQDILNPQNINVLRYFNDRGNLVWGARVLTANSLWKYVPVRRLFIYVEQSIYYGTQFVVFEPNDEPLWARVRQTITNFLTTVWHGGALQGGQPDEAFFVKCDHTTMTQDDIDNGRLICVIGIAPVKPAEFVIFRIQQKTLDTVAA